MLLVTLELVCHSVSAHSPPLLTSANSSGVMSPSVTSAFTSSVPWGGVQSRGCAGAQDEGVKDSAQPHSKPHGQGWAQISSCAHSKTQEDFQVGNRCPLETKCPQGPMCILQTPHKQSNR